MFSEERATAVLARLRSHSIEERLSALKAAQALFEGMFAPTMPDSEWAKKALIVEQFYNIIREELRASQIRVGKLPVTEAPKSTPKPKKGPKVKGALDFSKLEGGLAEFIKEIKNDSTKEKE